MAIRIVNRKFNEGMVVKPLVKPLDVFCAYLLLFVIILLPFLGTYAYYVSEKNMVLFVASWVVSVFVFLLGIGKVEEWLSRWKKP